MIEVTLRFVASLPPANSVVLTVILPDDDLTTHRGPHRSRHPQHWGAGGPSRYAIRSRTTALT